jgi:hypothetical protein
MIEGLVETIFHRFCKDLNAPQNDKVKFIMSLSMIDKGVIFYYR